MTIPLLSAQVLFSVYSLTGFLALGLLIRLRRSWRVLSAAIGAGIGMGVLLSWWLGDIVDVLEIAPTWVDRIWTGVACALIAIALVATIRGAWLNRVIAVLLVLLSLLSAGLAVNRDAGLFPTMADALGQSHVRPLQLPRDPDPSDVVADVSNWRAPSDMPSHGRYGSVHIPGTTSRFQARPGIVYLPPAALVAHAPKLPVVVMLSGQGPGASPANIIEAGRMVSRLDAIAAAHDGLAPIVVMPDQLAAATNNPMCLDGPLGRSATYLTKDVPAWIRAHMNVATDPESWAISGFSQGGTCALQLGATNPDLFGSWIDVSGQLGPILRNRSDTIERGFGGNEAAYAAAQPLRILREHAPYRDSASFLVAGADDSRYGPVLPKVSTAAESAGVRVTCRIIPHSGHDWHTAGVGLAEGVSWFMKRTHLMSPV